MGLLAKAIRDVLPATLLAAACKTPVEPLLSVTAHVCGLQAFPWQVRFTREYFLWYTEVMWDNQ